MLTYYVRSLLLWSIESHKLERRCLVKPPAQRSFEVSQVAWDFIDLNLHALNGQRLGKLA